METPTLKCPRSGRILTPLSMDYWRLKKKLNRIISDSSDSDSENFETPLRNAAESTRGNPSSTNGSSNMFLLHTPNVSQKPFRMPAKIDEEPSTTGVKDSRRQIQTPESRSDSTKDESSENEEFVFKTRPRRRAQRFTIESSSSESQEEQASGSSGSNQDGTENISRALFSTRLGSSSPPPSLRKPQTRVAIEISSDEENLPGLEVRVKGVRKSPPLKQNNLQNVQKTSVTEPKKRTVKTIGHGAMPPPSAPVKRTLKTQAKSGTKEDNEDDFDDLLEKLRNRKHEEDDYDESQVDLNNTVSEWEENDTNDRKFLESLDEENVPLKSCHKDAIIYRKSKFNSIKDDLTQKLFALFHRTVFQNRFESEIPITWNVRMAKSGGFCYYRRHVNGTRCARIELSPKVVDRVSRLRDVLLHEMCHAGAWLIHGYRDGHGVLFKFWGQRASQLFGLQVTTCHTYVIETKYIYKCTGCANEVRRHSKSLDTSRFICSNCKGRFELFVNNKQSKQMTPVSERKPSAFSKFVKEEYKVIKTKSPHLKHGEVMSALSERWKTMKNVV